MRWRRRVHQGGYHAPVLCGPCNNNTGQWYGTHYADFVASCA